MITFALVVTLTYLWKGTDAKYVGNARLRLLLTILAFGTIQTSAMGTYSHDKSLPSSPPLNTLVPEEQRGTGPLTLPHYQPEHYVTDTSESLNSLPSPNLPHELGAERHTGHPPISQPEGTPSQSPSTASQIPQPSPHQQHNKPSVHSSPQPSAMGAPSSSSPKSDFLTTPQLSTGIPSQHQAPPPLPGPPGNHGRRQRPRRFIQTADGQMLPSATVNSQNRRIANYFFQDYVNIAEEFKGYNLSHPEVNSAALQKVEKEFMKPGKAKRIDYERIARVAKQTGIQLRKPFELGSRTGPSSTQWKPTE
ncbi:hypothetical protein H0H93_009319 [Arthromyces matolae]|nr:hypothetical protein H0H93_009319 [Arthromyces matolae]